MIGILLALPLAGFLVLLAFGILLTFNEIIAIKMPGRPKLFRFGEPSRFRQAAGHRR